ncbi:MAG: fibronectin type III domain-containing protein [Planctomycetota bacterium]|jgi:hypothetical protein
MNKLSLITLGLFLFAALPVSAEPFLVCKVSPPAEKVDLYKVELNGQIVEFQPNPTGPYGFKYDLVGKLDGSYTVRVKAHNPVGWSDWSELINFTLPQK